METFKPLSEILQPDPRNPTFVRLDTFEPLNLEEHHAEAAAIQLNPTVPEHVRSYFATIQNLYVYAWFCYDFYPVVMFHCYAVMEMALRQRFPSRRGLGKLLKQAFKHKAIREKGFSFHRHRRKLLAEALWEERAWRRRSGTKGKMRMPVHKFDETLLKYLTGLRNSLAHPKIHTILPPGYAINELVFTAEFINQLFPL